MDILLSGVRKKDHLVGREICSMPCKEGDSKKLMPNNTVSINSYNVSLVTFSLWHPKRARMVYIKRLRNATKLPIQKTSPNKFLEIHSECFSFCLDHNLP